MNEPTVGALLALWNDVAPEVDASYNAWHADEHVPERLRVPGMVWGRRYRALEGTAGPRYLTLYGLRDPAVLESAPYRRLLSDPTPTSARMRPHLHNVSRWVCAVQTLRGTLPTDHLAVWTADSQARAERIAATAAPDASHVLVARRLTDAAPLPWLKSGQTQAVDGHWLCLLGGSDDMPPAQGSSTPDARLYAALPRRAPSTAGSCQ
jgi:hypothetical protein